MRFYFMMAWFFPIVLVSMSHAESNLVNKELTHAVAEFDDSSISKMQVTCAPTRGPASVTKYLSVNYTSNSTQKRILIETENNKITNVSLLEDEQTTSHWKTFIPKQGEFRIDATGPNAQQNHLVMRSSKTAAIKALEKLAPQTVNCCNQGTCGTVN